jgi:hypothetical protein
VNTVLAVLNTVGNVTTDVTVEMMVVVV